MEISDNCEVKYVHNDQNNQNTNSGGERKGSDGNCSGCNESNPRSTTTSRSGDGGINSTCTSFCDSSIHVQLSTPSSFSSLQSPSSQSAGSNSNGQSGGTTSFFSYLPLVASCTNACKLSYSSTDPAFYPIPDIHTCPPWFFPEGLSLTVKRFIVSLLHPEPAHRLSIEEALQHEWFRSMLLPRNYYRQQQQKQQQQQQQMKEMEYLSSFLQTTGGNSNMKMKSSHKKS